MSGEIPYMKLELKSRIFGLRHKFAKHYIAYKNNKVIGLNEIFSENKKKGYRNPAHSQSLQF